MYDFFNFFDQKVKAYPMHLLVEYGKMSGWTIYIYRKGCGINETDLEIVNVQDFDMSLCFAKAHVGLKEWLSLHEGGY